jgi:hypothetical protein
VSGQRLVSAGGRGPIVVVAAAAARVVGGLLATLGGRRVAIGKRKSRKGKSGENEGFSQHVEQSVVVLVLGERGKGNQITIEDTERLYKCDKIWKNLGDDCR